MKIWFRRIFALAFLSLGIAMTFLPFNETRSGSAETEVVTLEKVELLSFDEISDQFPEMEIIDITGPELNPDDYPDLWRAFINLGEDWLNESGDIWEWNEFQDSALSGISDSQLVVFREGLVSCTINKNHETEEGIPETVIFNYLGRYNPYTKELTELDLVDYPSIIRIVKSIEEGDEIDYELFTIPKDKWDKMVDHYLDPIQDSQTFYFNGNYYGPEFSWDIAYMDGSVTGLGKWLKIIGVILLLIGFQLILKLYFKKGGAMLSPFKTVIIYDVITLLFAIPAAYMTINFVLAKTLFIQPIIEEDFILLMGVFFFCIGIPIVSRITSRFTQNT